MKDDAQLGSVIGLLLVLLSVGVLTFFSRGRVTRVVDQVLALGLLAWTIFLVWQPRFGARPPAPDDEFIEHMAFQVCVAAACRLILTGTNLFRPVVGPIWAWQLGGGGALLLMWVLSGTAVWMDAWACMNAVAVAVVAGVLVLRWHIFHHEKSYWIAALSGVLIAFSLVPDYWHHPSSLLGVGGLFVFPAALIGLWSLVTVRQRRPQAAPGDATTQMELQRQRIAQEVHDGVGSQLVSVLSSLDAKDPGQQVLALALERCLLDLKITVDSLQPEPPSLLDGLAMLRYRLQPSLDRMGMRLVWSVDDHPEVASLPQLSVTHALRIVQEAVANALRHSQAGALEVSCIFVPVTGSVRVAVVDDGIGIDAQTPDRPRGRGLAGMRRRAEEAGVHFQLSTAPGQGCRVLLDMPVVPPSPPTA